MHQRRSDEEQAEEVQAMAKSCLTACGKCWSCCCCFSPAIAIITVLALSTHVAGPERREDSICELHLNGTCTNFFDGCVSQTQIASYPPAPTLCPLALKCCMPDSNNFFLQRALSGDTNNTFSYLSDDDNTTNTFSYFLSPPLKLVTDHFHDTQFLELLQPLCGSVGGVIVAPSVGWMVLSAFVGTVSGVLINFISSTTIAIRAHSRIFGAFGELYFRFVRRFCPNYAQAHIAQAELRWKEFQRWKSEAAGGDSGGRPMVVRSTAADATSAGAAAAAAASDAGPHSTSYAMGPSSRSAAAPMAKPPPEDECLASCCCCNGADRGILCCRQRSTEGALYERFVGALDRARRHRRHKNAELKKKNAGESDPLEKAFVQGDCSESDDEHPFEKEDFENVRQHFSLEAAAAETPMSQRPGDARTGYTSINFGVEEEAAASSSSSSSGDARAAAAASSSTQSEQQGLLLNAPAFDIHGPVTGNPLTVARAQFHFVRHRAARNSHRVQRLHFARRCFRLSWGLGFKSLLFVVVGMLDAIYQVSTSDKLDNGWERYNAWIALLINGSVVKAMLDCSTMSILTHYDKVCKMVDENADFLLGGLATGYMFYNWSTTMTMMVVFQLCFSSMGKNLRLGESLSLKHLPKPVTWTFVVFLIVMWPALFTHILPGSFLFTPWFWAFIICGSIAVFVPVFLLSRLRLLLRRVITGSDDISGDKNWEYAADGVFHFCRLFVCVMLATVMGNYVWQIPGNFAILTYVRGATGAPDNAYLHGSGYARLPFDESLTRSQSCYYLQFYTNAMHGLQTVVRLF